MAVATPLLGHFLTALNGFILARNSTQLASYLALEPPFADTYTQLITELRSAYGTSNTNSNKTTTAQLESKCSTALPAARDGADGSPWLPFVKFVAQYLVYLRDVDPDPRMYLRTYEALAELQVRGNSALNHPVLGYLLLPVVVQNARLVCRLAVGLDKQPGLVALGRGLGGGSVGGGGGGEEGGGPRETLPERAANTLRNAFVTCLNDRTAGTDAQGRPEGKKRGIYTIANLCLKILFQCKKTRNATQIFENIYNLSPPLDGYPKAERVTYLYYLGRFFFQNSHFFRAQLVLQHAYDKSPADASCVSQRRRILIYLVTANLLLGRFPSETLLSRPEAAGFAEHFLPLCHAIRKGDLAAYRNHLSFHSGAAAWFLRFRILLPLRNSGEVLVWRSLARKTWLLNGTRPDPTTKIAPTIDLHDLVALFAALERGASPSTAETDPDFGTAEEEENNNEQPLLRDITGIESLLSSLIDQGLLNGYLSHARRKFAITGSKAKGGNALKAGFPRVWEVVSAKADREGLKGEVPGWKRKVENSSSSSPFGRGGAGGGVGPGMVVNLSGARPVGALG